MKHSQDEIVNALKVIMETCEEAKCCVSCPLRHKFSSDKCYVSSCRPDKWKLEPTEVVWRAFNG